LDRGGGPECELTANCKKGVGLNPIKLLENCAYVDGLKMKHAWMSHSQLNQ